MPLGSSSAAPVMSPGPSLERNDLRSWSAMRPRRGYGCLASLFRRSLEALSNDVPLARILAAGGRLGMLHACKAALQLGHQLMIRPAGEDLGDIGAARPKHLAREFQPCLDQCHGAQMVGLLVADGVRRHVRQDEVG